MGATANPPLDRVAERRHAVALARHYREADGMPIAQIAQRLGRAPATIKGYFYDPSYANKGPYRSLGATRAVYGAPRRRKPTRAQQDGTHAAMAWRRQPDAPSIRRSSARQGWWIGWERPSAAVA